MRGRVSWPAPIVAWKKFETWKNVYQDGEVSEFAGIQMLQLSWKRQNGNAAGRQLSCGNDIRWRQRSEAEANLSIEAATFIPTSPETDNLTPRVRKYTRIYKCVYVSTRVSRQQHAERILAIANSSVRPLLCMSHANIRGVTTPRRPRNAGGGEVSRGPFAAGKNCRISPTSADHLILIHQVKQGYVNRRNVI